MDLTRDLLVYGGNLAGVAAAMSAARQGSKVMLISKNELLGGCAACVKESACKGIYGEIYAAVQGIPACFEKNGCKGDVKDPGHLDCVLSKMLKACFVTVVRGVELVKANVKGARLASVTVKSACGEETTYLGNYFVDACGCLSKAAGVELCECAKVKEVCCPSCANVIAVEHCCKCDKDVAIPYQALVAGNPSNLFVAGKAANVACELKEQFSAGMLTALGEAAGCASVVAAKHRLQAAGVVAQIEELRKSLADRGAYLG